MLELLPRGEHADNGQTEQLSRGRSEWPSSQNLSEYTAKNVGDDGRG